MIDSHQKVTFAKYSPFFQEINSFLGYSHTYSEIQFVPLLTIKHQRMQMNKHSLSDFFVMLQLLVSMNILKFNVEIGAKFDHMMIITVPAWNYFKCI